mgnify:CR=1 FL=1
MRLIDADALDWECIEHKYGARDDAVVDCEIMIDIAPTINAVPKWIPCEERLPKDLEAVNITWINHRPMTYYADIKDKPFTATAIHYEDKWWWYSPICEDMLAECGKSECDEMDADIEVTAWMPLPEPYVAERKDDE